MAGLSNLNMIFPFLVYELALGFGFGFVRSGERDPDWANGLWTGMLLWGCLTTLFCMIGMGIVLLGHDHGMVDILGIMPLVGEPSLGRRLVWILGTYLMQVFCGMAAGLIVESYVARKNRRDEQLYNCQYGMK